jgi:hypothetical protein
VKQLLVLSVFALALVGCGGDGDDEAAADGATTTAAAAPVEVELSPHGDGQVSGTVLLTPAEADTMDVAIELDPPVDAGGSHIHNISCADYTDEKAASTIFSDLGAIQGGKLRTTSAVSLGDVRKPGYSINVHANEAPYQAVACGDIPTE